MTEVQSDSDIDENEVMQRRMEAGRLRILHICRSSVYSGAESVAVKICCSLDNQFDFLYCCPKGSIENELQRKNVPYHLLDSFSYVELNRIVKEYKPDIIHAHDFTAGVYGALFARRIDIISHIHHNANWMKRWTIKSLIYACVMHRFTRILLVSKKIEEEAVFFHNKVDKLSIIGNPIDQKELFTLAEMATLQEQYDILFIGRIVYEKDPLRFIGIIKMLSEELPNIRVGMVGDGDLFKKCAQQIEENQISSVITMLGYQQNPYGLLKNCKVICITSRWEGYGLVAAEAKAFGKPVLVTPVGGLLELFQDDSDAFCYHDAEFVNKLKLILQESREGTWRNKAQKTSKGVDNISIYMKTIKETYMEAIKS